MKALHQRLTKLDDKGDTYWLDYVVLKSGFTYRNLDVLSHDEHTLFARPHSPEGAAEVYLRISEITSLRIETQ